MKEIIDGLATEVGEIIQKLDLSSDEKELRSLQEEAAAPDFWSDNIRAAKNTRRASKLENRIKPWRDLEAEIKAVQEFVGLGDATLEKDLKKQIEKIQKDLAKSKKQLQFSGPYDDYDVLLSIHAGAGGTDAQDWAQMLLRMYARWAESHDVKAVIIDESPGEEAGIKSVSMELSGDFLFAKLKGEHGVHRLVRLSPFNSANLRQTSFAKVEVLPKIDEPETVPLDEKDLKIDVYRAGGHGGQSVNTTDSAVRVTHLPTNIVVAIQNERSQLQNKETALTILRSKLAQLQIEQHAEKISELKGPNEQAAWGNQIRSYVLHPYKMVKDLRTKHESSDPDLVLDGNLDPFIDSYLESSIS